jgi:hypothetical protein
MSGIKDSEAPALEIDEFDANPKLAQLVSPRFALRYHVLPIAESEGRLTIATANPRDRNLQARVQREIGRPLQLVKANPSAINALVAELWPEYVHRPFHLAVLLRDPHKTTLTEFGRTLGSWLRADEVHVEYLPRDSREFKALWSSFSIYDLVILNGPPRIRSVDRVRNAFELQTLCRSNSSFLLARQTRWPVDKLVCILQGQPSDLVSARWVARLAHTCDCLVDVVVIVPPVPLMYAGMRRMEISLKEILHGNSLSGRYLRRSVKYLANWDINSRMRLLHGYSPLHIEADLLTQRPDLIIISRQPQNNFLNGFQEELVDLMVSRGEASLLVGRCRRKQGKENHA